MSSPGVITREFDLTLNTNADIGSASAMIGTFRWGPVNQAISISTNESEVVRTFGTPDNDTTVSFHSATNYLLYATPLIIVRVLDEATAKNAYPTAETPLLVKNFEDYQAKESANTGISFIGRYPGQMGNAIEISCSDSTGFSAWDYASNFDYAPESTDFHVVVIDATGVISGTIGTVLETFESVNKTPGSKRDDGTAAYVKDVIESQSNYVWLFDLDEIVFTGGDTAGIYEIALQGGVDANKFANASYTDAISLLSNSETIEYVAIFMPDTDDTNTASLVEMVETRAETIAFTAPNLSDVFNVTQATATANVVEYFDTELNKNSSYFFNVDNWKMVYDKYLNKAIWIPCNSDAAALYARLFVTGEPWESPAGYNRGQLKNVIKLAWNPNKANRDTLYKSSVNSIVSFPGEGTMLFGDKTGLKKKSAFSRINVRSLFNVMKKTIAVTGRRQLFEINDYITRSIFTGSVDRYLDTVQSRRGIDRKRVVCDETNNTPQVIQSNEFVGAIYASPLYSINTVKLGFIAVGGGVEFEEIEGQGFGF